MQSFHQCDGSPTGVVRLFWRHKGKMLLVFSVVVALAVAYLATSPRKYLSEAKIYVRLGHESVALDPTATTGHIVTSGDSRESEINAILELFASRAMAEQIVDQFGPQVVLEKKKKNDGPSLGDRLAFLDSANLNPLKVYSVRDKAVQHFQEHLLVRAAKRTNVISISYEAESPALAHDVVESLLRVARDEYLRMSRTKGSQEFFVEQAAQLKTELETLEGRLRDLKNETGLAALVQQRQIELERIGKLEDNLVLARAEEDAVLAEIETRRQQLANLPQMIVTEQVSGQPNTPEFGMREELYKLEIREKELSSKLTDIAPQLMQIRQQIADARQVVKDEDAKVQITRATNKSHEASELALHERSAQLVALKARGQSLETKIAAAREELKRINEHEVQIAQVERAIDLAKSNYSKYAENLEQARIDQELDVAKISSLNPIQLPSFSETPISPQPLLVLALAFVGGGLASIGTALLSERGRTARFVSANGHAVLSDDESPDDDPNGASDVPAVFPRRAEHAPANPR